MRMRSLRCAQCCDRVVATARNCGTCASEVRALLVLSAQLLKLPVTGNDNRSLYLGKQSSKPLQFILVDIAERHTR